MPADDEPDDADESQTIDEIPSAPRIEITASRCRALLAIDDHGLIESGDRRVVKPGWPMTAAGSSFREWPSVGYAHGRFEATSPNAMSSLLLRP